jgi:hypothetical protein
MLQLLPAMKTVAELLYAELLRVPAFICVRAQRRD